MTTYIVLEWPRLETSGDVHVSQSHKPATSSVSHDETTTGGSGGSVSTASTGAGYAGGQLHHGCTREDTKGISHVI